MAAGVSSLLSHTCPADPKTNPANANPEKPLLFPLQIGRSSVHAIMQCPANRSDCKEGRAGRGAHRSCREPTSGEQSQAEKMALAPARGALGGVSCPCAVVRASGPATAASWRGIPAPGILSLRPVRRPTHETTHNPGTPERWTGRNSSASRWSLRPLMLPNVMRTVMVAASVDVQFNAGSRGNIQRTPVGIRRLASLFRSLLSLLGAVVEDEGAPLFRVT
jgi:hypothetical protein